MQENREKAFLGKLDYLRKLVKILEDIELFDINSNLLYEIAYASEYINSLNEEIKSKEIKDIGVILEGILDTVDYNNILTGGREYKSLLKSKFSDMTSAGFYKEGTYERGSIGAYLWSLKRRYIVYLFLITASFHMSVMDLNFKESDALLRLFPKVVHIVFGFAVVVLLLTVLFSFSIDALFILFPNRFKCIQSEVSIEAVYACNLIKGGISYDRVSRNKAWLDDMLQEYKKILQEKPACGFRYKSLVAIKDNLEKVRDKDFYKELTKIEVLYNDWSIV